MRKLAVAKINIIIVDRKTYTFDEAFKASLDYFTGDELAAKYG